MKDRSYPNKRQLLKEKCRDLAVFMRGNGTGWGKDIRRLFLGYSKKCKGDLEKPFSISRFFGELLSWAIAFYPMCLKGSVWFASLGSVSCNFLVLFQISSLFISFGTWDIGINVFCILIRILKAVLKKINFPYAILLRSKKETGLMTLTKFPEVTFLKLLNIYVKFWNIF